MTPTREQTDCTHDQLQSWHFEDGTGPAGMWSCKDCGLKFVPIIETEAARAQALEDAKAACVGIYRAHDKKHPSDYDQGAMNAAEACECAVEALKGKQ